MSTLSGIASKGEKGKSKFQSLDINSIYRGESLEPHQAKSTLPRKHGMQSLGKVPSARRPPANLPSLKSEHSGNDPAISLVPTGGTGWGNKPGETGPPGTPQQSQQQEATSTAAAPQPVATPPQVAPAAVIPSTAPPIAALATPTQGPPYPAPPVQVQQIPHLQQQQQQQQHGADKSWSSIMAGPGEANARPPNFLAHQSAQFQQEFPKLSSGDGQVPPTGQKGGSDSQYGPGPSLRPQTEGSWIQGGGRNAPGGPMPGPPVHPGGADAAGARSNSGQPAPPGVHMGPAGHAPGSGPGMPPGPIPHQFRGVLPQFMYSQRGNFPGNFPVNFAGGAMGPPRHRMPAPGAPHPGSRPPPRHPDPDEVVPRPIIKEEELSKMDDIARDPGWATHDDIDYNQKLAFSDDEDSHKEEPPPRKDSRTLIVGKEEKRPVEPTETKHPVRQSQDARERGGPADHRERSGPPDSRLEQRERSGPPEGRSMDQRERSGPPEGRGMEQRGPPPEQRGWQQGRQMPPPGDFRGGPPVGPPHMGPQPIVSMRVQPPQGPHVGEDEEIWHERRRQQSEEVANAVVRAKQRKEEEEKRYEETRQAAWQKLQILEQKMGKGRTSESTEDVPTPGSTTTIPLPEWEKDRESRERDRSRTSSEGKESEKAADIRLIGQTGGERNAFLRSDAAPGGRSDVLPEQRDRDRGLRDVRSSGEQQPVFSGQFQTNLPPRFQKQQAERSERSDRQERHHWAGSGPGMHFPGQMPGGGAKAAPRRSSEAEREAMLDRPRDGRDQMTERPRDVRDQMPERSRDGRDQMSERPRDGRDPMADRPRESRDQMSDRPRDARDPYRRDGGRGTKAAYYEPAQDYQRSYHERDHADRLWERDSRQYQHRREAEKEPSYEKHVEEEVGKEWREERPQRPDSRSSRESRGNEEMRPVEYHAPAKVESWADAPFDPPLQQHYEVKDDKKKVGDYYRSEERGGGGGGRHAPGPITREKMEAAGGEMKRSLTQLRRGNAAPVAPVQGERKPDTKLVDGQDKKERRSPTQPHGWGGGGGQGKSLAQLHLEGGGQRPKDGGSKSWADALPDPEPIHEAPKPPGADRPEGEPAKKAEAIEAGPDDGAKSHGRSGRGANWTGGYPVPPRKWGAPPPPARGRRVGSGSRAAARSNKGWPHGSESEYSESDVAVEIGKDDNAREEVARKDRDSKPGKKSDRDAARREADTRRSFAPRGEPSRRGRGGFRAHGGVAGPRMDGYGPPSSKSPFGGHDNKKPDGKEELDGEMIGNDDKVKKQHGPSAGVIGSGPRSGGQHPASSGSSASKARSRDGPRRAKAPVGDATDENNREWETTSENSDPDDAAKKSYGGRDGGRRAAAGGGSRSSRGGPIGPASGNRDRQAPSGEKRSNNGYGRERNAAPSSSGSANGRSSNRGKAPAGKDGSVAIQRLDEIKIHDPALMVAALADLNAQKKAARPEKDKSLGLEGLDLNNFASVVIVDDHPAVARDEDRFPFDADNGFQEVRSKKNVKEARKVEEPAAAAAGGPHQKGASYQGGRQNAGSPVIGRSVEHKEQRKIRPLLQDVRSQAPSRENSGNAVGGAKSPFERPRQNKLPPRLAKQKENNRLQKQQQQQQHHGMHNDVCEMNSINQNISLFPVKEQGPVVPAVNAWDKPLQANSPGANVGQAMQLGSLTNPDACMMDPNEEAGGTGSQRSTPNGDKMAAKMAADKAALDGSSAPVQTIIFENTNYKTSPGDNALKSKFNHLKSQKSGHKMDDGSDGSLGYGGKPGTLGDQLGGGVKTDGKNEAIQMPMSFAKEDGADMKLDFTFDSELSQLTDDKKSVGSARSMHNMAPGGGSQQQQLSTADLNFKIASVKKVWENMPTVQEQTEDGNMVTSTFANVEFGKPNECQQRDDGSPRNAAEMVYAHHPHSPGPQMQGNPYGGGVVVSAVPSMVKGDLTSTSSNVCKVKPQQQPPMSVQGHPGPLSPPPFNSANQGPGGHINYQAALGGGGQFGGISAIPSPPTVLYNSSPQMPSQGGLYGGFQIDGSQVLGGQARSQFSQFPPYGMSQGLGQSTAYNQQSMYMPHPPPSNAPQEHMYQSPLSQYRLQATQGPFGQSQQLSNNPSTVLISSSSNSLMSASVKPSSQIGAIGTKGGVPYQTASMPNAQQTSQMYIQYDPSQVMGQNYLSGSQLVQRSGPVQSNVVPSIQASSSYYSGSAGQGGFYQPASSGLQPGQVQGGGGTGSPYGLQGYNAPSGNAAMQSFGSQFLSSPLQMAQPYRGNPNVPVGGAPAYLKTSNQHVMADHSASANGRAQLKSPSSNDQVMQGVQSVFSGTVYPPQIPSPKSRGMKSATSATASPPQPHHKMTAYGSVQSAVQSAVQLAAYQRQAAGSRGMPAGMGQPPPPRYPPPIQRPNVAYQPPPPNSMGARHRPQHRPPPVNKMQTYYGGHGSNLKMESGSDSRQDGNIQQSNEAKLTDVGSGGGNGTTTGSKPTQTADSKKPAEGGKDDVATSAAAAAMPSME